MKISKILAYALKMMCIAVISWLVSRGLEDWYIQNDFSRSSDVVAILTCLVIVCIWNNFERTTR